MARLDEVQEELLYYPGFGVGIGVSSGVGVSKKFNVIVFYVMGKALSGKLSCPCDRSCCVYIENGILCVVIGIALMRQYNENTQHTFMLKKLENISLLCLLTWCYD